MKSHFELKLKETERMLKNRLKKNKLLVLRIYFDLNKNH